MPLNPLKQHIQTNTLRSVNSSASFPILNYGSNLSKRFEKVYNFSNITLLISLKHID